MTPSLQLELLVLYTRSTTTPYSSVVPHPEEFQLEAFEIEIRAYQRLGEHPRIPRFSNASPISTKTKVQWAQDAAEGLAYIHSKEIVHADFGCHNLIIDHSDRIKIIDFSGSGIDGVEALVCYSWFSFRPSPIVNIQTDIFAFGSMLFELDTGKYPYQELEGTMDLGLLASKVEKLFSQNEFPSVEGLLLGPIISSCWNGDYESMDEICRAIHKLQANMDSI
ncbi:kinase-like protein [Penicillium malachiteum]|uniref:Kinase-like protein n=1 Tax=Penicillium malachiteum TaxID=1324776 RepID=A0AAD6MT63_9EURO|nr:kinase-like protein [Penicillium malachiteum]